MYHLGSNGGPDCFCGLGCKAAAFAEGWRLSCFLYCFKLDALEELGEYAALFVIDACVGPLKKGAFFLFLQKRIITIWITNTPASS